VNACLSPGCSSSATKRLVYGQSYFDVCEACVGKHSKPVKVLNVGESPIAVWQKWEVENRGLLDRHAKERRCWNDYRE